MGNPTESNWQKNTIFITRLCVCQRQSGGSGSGSAALFCGSIFLRQTALLAFQTFHRPTLAIYTHLLPLSELPMEFIFLCRAPDDGNPTANRREEREKERERELFLSHSLSLQNEMRRQIAQEGANETRPLERPVGKEVRNFQRKTLFIFERTIKERELSSWRSL